MNRFRAVILAGGSGERFWPLSTPARPKQFLSVFGGRSLIRRSVERLWGVARPEDVFIITAQHLVQVTRRELPEIPRANIIGEPMRRDTGAAVALGTAVAGRERGTVLGFFPADQLIEEPAAFRRTLKTAIRRALKAEAIVTLGIAPTQPATGFGYIDPAHGRFVEKPDLPHARAYLRRGYLWNAGMFIARSECFRSAFAAHAPALVPVAELTRFTSAALKKLYEPLARISFDYAVMEPVSRGEGALHVEVVAGDFGWDDVGSYAAFAQHFPVGADGNITLGAVRAVESCGCLSIARGAPIALFGVRDLVVVTTPDNVLVCPKSKAAELKQLFKA